MACLSALDVLQYSQRMAAETAENGNKGEENMRFGKLLCNGNACPMGIGKDVLLMKVNGQLVKTCLWKPYEADLTPYVHEGENEITLGVVNTLMNLLESTRNPSGLFKAEIVPMDRYELTI